MLKFFLSIKTYLWVTGISIAVFLAGSLYIPQNLAVFSGINDIPLLSWLTENAGDKEKFFWIYLLIGLMALLWICTLICSLDAVIKRVRRGNLIRVLSPQILHLAVLFVILGHGISAVSGYKLDVPMDLNIPQQVKGFSMTVHDIQFRKDPGESSTRWIVNLEVNGTRHVLEVGKPAFSGGVGFFAKSAQKRKMKTIIGVIYDPGVIWEIIGAVLYGISAAGVFYSRFRDTLPSGA